MKKQGFSPYLPFNESKIIIVLRSIIAGLNILALAGSLTYLIHPMPYLFFNLFGYVILLTLLGNIVLAYLGGMYRYLDYCYLLIHIVSMLLIPIMNTLASSNVQNKTSQSIFVLVLYNAIFLYGAAVAGLRIKYDIKNRKSDSEIKTQAQSGRFRNVMRWVVVMLLCLVLFFGFFLIYILLGKDTNNMIEVFIPEYAIFWGLLMPGVSILIIKLMRGKKGSVSNCCPTINKIILAMGIIICAICFIPLAAVPFTIRNADAAYRETFGSGYLDDKSISEQYGFMRSPFSLQNYFFGTRTNDYIIKEDVLYYSGTDGIDTGIKLHFDAYMPLADNGNFQRKNPVLIRIHGGSWTMGDKGFSNYSETNKHFVNQGYAVFDIQYGLSDKNPSFASSVVPASVKGNFNIDDMVRHIGIFTRYLADHADEYDADLNSVFISGGSAGGQLAVAVALGITSGKYTDILDSRLRVRGLIPFYPANSLSPHVGIGGTPDLVDPVALVDEYSPPCLIYHGTHDGIVDPKYASILQNTYMENSTKPCALLWMWFGSHGSDFYTPGYFNQVFMYYMERFMSQYK